MRWCWNPTRLELDFDEKVSGRSSMWCHVPLSVRAHGALRNRGVRTIAQFLNLDPASCREQRNCGKTTVHELRFAQDRLRECLSANAPRQVSTRSGDNLDVEVRQP